MGLCDDVDRLAGDPGRKPLVRSVVADGIDDVDDVDDEDEDEDDGGGVGGEAGG